MSISAVRHIFFDFDGTLTVTPWLPRLQCHAVSDNEALCSALTDEEVITCFGGMARLQLLGSLLTALRTRGVHLFVLSHGRVRAITSLLARSGLECSPRTVFSKIYASDMQELQAFGNVKAELIRAFIRSPRGLAAGGDEVAAARAAESVLFVDDSTRHIAIANDTRACRTLHVSGHGLSESELQYIASLCGGGGTEGNAAATAESGRTSGDHDHGSDDVTAMAQEKSVRFADEGEIGCERTQRHASGHMSIDASKGAVHASSKPLAEVCLIQRDNKGRPLPSSAASAVTIHGDGGDGNGGGGDSEGSGGEVGRLSTHSSAKRERWVVTGVEAGGTLYLQDRAHARTGCAAMGEIREPTQAAAASPPSPTQPSTVVPLEANRPGKTSATGSATASDAVRALQVLDRSVSDAEVRLVALPVDTDSLAQGAVELGTPVSFNTATLRFDGCVVGVDKEAAVAIAAFEPVTAQNGRARTVFPVSAEESLHGHHTSNSAATTQRGETYSAPTGARFLLRYVDSHNQIMFGQVER
eukprot:g327.t1